MEVIKVALLQGQKSVFVEGILFERLPTLKRDTQKNKEREAEAKAKELFKLIS